MMFEISGSKLDFFKDLYEDAVRAMASELELMQRRIDQYNGSTEIDGSSVPAKQVRNITYELIESQMTNYIPTPAVTGMQESKRMTRNSKSIETLLRQKRNDLPFERMNDLDERLAPIYGGSVWLVEWDESIKTHSTVGDVRVSCHPPTAFVGQPNVHHIEDMDYCFIRFETTREEIVRKYGVKPSVAEEAESDEAGNEDGYTATLYVCYYKNRDDKVCQYVWSGDVELCDVDDYYARRRKVCRSCGKREGLCACEEADLLETSAEYEELTEPITLSDGTVIPAVSPVIENGRVVEDTVMQQLTDSRGQMVFDDASGLVTPVIEAVTLTRTEPTRLPYYTPTVFPIVIRKNTSKEDSLFGTSDCDMIRPQQQAINKIETRIMEKLLRAGVTPVMPEDARVALDNSVFGQVIRMSPGENASQYGVIDTTPNITQDIAQSERLYDQAKRILGISDSYQGQYDGSAQSGKAKQLQIQQAAGRLDSKRRMKNAAYADLDKIIFSLYLAYADEPRPSVRVDANGCRENVEFNRYDFLLLDEMTGEYYYDDRYLFSADASIDLEDSRTALWEKNLESFRLGTYGDPRDRRVQLAYWRNMERAHFPYARDNVDRLEAEIRREQEVRALKARAEAAENEVRNHEAYEQEILNTINGGQTNVNNA